MSHPDPSRGSAAAVLCALTALAAATPAQAQEPLAGVTLICDFTEMCLEEAGCTYAQYSADVALPDAFPGDATILPPDGPAEGGAVLSEGMLLVTGHANGAGYALARSPEGLARLAVFAGAPVSTIVYRGQCRIAQ